MRIFIAALLVLFAFPVAAQSQARPRPPGTLPLEEVPPPPPIPPVDEKDSLEKQQQVTTRVEGEDTIEEHRINNRLYMMRVTPKHGHPYVLIDHRGDGQFARQEGGLDTGVRVPQWVLFEF